MSLSLRRWWRSAAAPWSQTLQGRYKSLLESYAREEFRGDEHAEQQMERVNPSSLDPPAPVRMEVAHVAKRAAAAGVVSQDWAAHVEEWVAAQ